jgi:hypothetical protein
MRFDITLQAIISGATAQVEARDLQEARRKAEKGDFVDAIDLKVGELVDWEVKSVHAGEEIVDD